MEDPPLLCGRRGKSYGVLFDVSLLSSNLINKQTSLYIINRLVHINVHETEIPTILFYLTSD